MQLVSFADNGTDRLGIYQHGKVYRTTDLDKILPATMNEFLKHYDRYFPLLQKALGKIDNSLAVPHPQLCAPVPFPSSFRDGYAFRQHVAAARKNRGLAMIEVYDHCPVFYFGTTANQYGPGLVRFMPDCFERLDYELEVAAVISRPGINISAENAHEYIAGLMILNDWSARTLQMEEMQLNLGPAKGKDLGCSTGPVLVSLDELVVYEVPPPPHHRGKSWKLGMRAYVNGQLLSCGNLADMDWTFGELIERASYGVQLQPGDVIGSGTVGTGCLLELNATAKTDRWLKERDEVTMEVDGLGVLSNVIARQPGDHSLLNRKATYDR